MDRGKLLFRAIKEADLPSVCQIAEKVGPGFTSLPNQPKIIAEKVKRAVESFKAENANESRLFLFVLEDVVENTIVGTAAIEACISHFNPYYSYEVATIIHKSDILKEEKLHQALLLENNYQNASVLGTLYLDAKYRGLKRGEFLSRARCLFIAEFPELFSNLIIAEMRGYFDENGISPFWEKFGRLFYNADSTQINYLSAKHGTKVIADLMPKFPVYLCLLPESVNEAIGKPHPDTEPAVHVLEKEGFSYHKFIDILDGGPIIEVEKTAIKTIQNSKKLKLKGFKEQPQSPLSMISNAKMDFKASFGTLEIELSEHGAEEILLEKEIADRLGVKIGDWIRFASLE